MFPDYMKKITFARVIALGISNPEFICPTLLA